MRKALEKDIVRDIIKSRGRFLSILFIVALGVAFFSGIKVGPIVMQKTSDKYYDDYNLMDIRLLSTLGLTDEDVNAIKGIDGVKGIFPTYSIDVMIEHQSKESVLKVHGLPLDDIENNSDDYINQVKVIEGRLPQKSGEAVVENSKIEHLKLPIGSRIKLESGSENNLSDNLKVIEYEIVGVIQTPYYLSYDKGSSNIGSGTVDSVIMIPQDDFKMEAYTEIFLTVDGAKDKNSYKDEYFDVVDKVKEKIENISDIRIQARYNEVKDKANKNLDKGKSEFAEKKKEVDEKLVTAQNDINKYKSQIKEAENTLGNKKSDTKIQIEDGKLQIEEGEIKLKEGYKEYEQGLATFYQNKELAQIEIEKAEKNLKAVEEQITVNKNEILKLEYDLKNQNISEEEKAVIQANLDSKKYVLSQTIEGYEKGKKGLDSKKQQLESAEKKLINTKIVLDSNKEKLELQKSNLVKAENTAKYEFEKAEAEINKQKKKISEAEIELKDAKLEAMDELAKAEKKIKDSEDEIDKIEMPEWYVLDRNSHYSYAEYKSNAQSIDALATVFPIFFFSVAALVCLTTMTRMVDEQRINIGTLKALGYSTAKISKKYIIYALSASLLGSMLGILIGFTIFPIIIFNSYGIMYTLPPVILDFNIPIAVGVTLTSVSITTFAAYSACYKELIETPSVLMRPRSPKNGKRILLEKVPFIWNKISFIGKVTVRNIFRYKQRIFMTVLGIAGCTALILTGLGIRDSIQMIVDGQFGSIFKYDMSITIDNDLKVSQLKELNDYISENKEIVEHQFMSYQNAKVSSNGVEKPLTIVVPENIDNMDKLIYLKDRKSQEHIKLGKTGVVLSEKVAKQLNVKVGDSINLINSKDKKVQIEITGVAENYVSSYAYISKEHYQELFGRSPEYNRIIGTLRDTSKTSEASLSEELVKESAIKGVSFNTGIRENFSDTIKSLNYVVLLMTVSAGTLAFIVLYNLTNVNISERIREIATIKVLGFYDSEVSAYIYRENIILTVIGTIVGLGLGNMLHRFIMVTVETESLMFGRVIFSNSYIIAAVLTIVLGSIVNIAMYYKLKNVKMVESLKSVD